MALEQTITIVNNSGKIIKTGKQLYSIFKDAQGNYRDKKAEIKSEKLQRSQSFDPRDLPPQQPRYYEDAPQYYPPHQPKYVDDGDRYYPPRAYDQRSEASSRRSRRSRSVHSQSRQPRDDYYETRSRPALTMDNLKTHSEVSSVTPSRAPPRNYAAPYAETIPMDLAIPARSQLARTEMRSVAPSAYGPGGGAMVQRNRSAGELVHMKPRKEIDMDLAYGDIPPDLADRTDLDPKYVDEKQATAMVHRVEGLLTEAKCLHHSATTTMAQLQKDPDQAAAVALSLAELSKMVKKTSPAFLALLKSGSPAVFSLLSSPHFLIGTSIAVGVTVVCFGGWKIVQRVKEQQQAREALMYEQAMDRPAPSRTQSEYAPRRAPTEYSAGMDEALIIEDDLSDLSSIETWRRGIVPYGEDERADMELITPLANKENKDRYGDDFDVKSRRSTRTSKTHESHRSHRSHRSEASERSERSERSHRSHRSRRDDESIAGSERSHRSSRSKRSERVETRSIDDRRSRKDDESLVLRPKSHRNSNNMLKALFKSKEKKERELVMA